MAFGKTRKHSNDNKITNVKSMESNSETISAAICCVYWQYGTPSD